MEKLWLLIATHLKRRELLHYDKEGGLHADLGPFLPRNTCVGICVDAQFI